MESEIKFIPVRKSILYTYVIGKKVFKRLYIKLSNKNQVFSFNINLEKGLNCFTNNFCSSLHIVIKLKIVFF